jgi:NNP family nitrate/nitrite transporter-like MFS transporter
MNNIRDVRATLGEQLVIFRRKHTWVLAWLYTGTFGTFIGLAASFPILLSALSPGAGLVKWAFVGPLLGAVVRPLGGWLSDRLGGARVTFWTFAVMVVAAIGTYLFLPSGAGGNEIAWFYAAFILVFITAGIGNGSVFRLVPTVYLTLHRRGAEGKDQAAQEAAHSAGEIEASVALGVTAGFAALGLFLIPAFNAVSIAVTGTAGAALIVFIGFCLTCLFTTWWWYRREGAEARCG